MRTLRTLFFLVAGSMVLVGSVWFVFARPRTIAVSRRAMPSASPSPLAPSRENIPPGDIMGATGSIPLIPTATGTDAAQRIALMPIVRSAFGEGPLAAEPLTVLLVGIPGAGNPAPKLSDTIIAAHLDPAEKRAWLFSLPRDLLVRLPDGFAYTKLNGLYERGGITALRLKAEAITGLAVTRYVVVDLAAVRDIVDALGGVNVYVERDLVDPRFPGPNFTYETFALEAGWRYLDGITATRFARTRNDVEGDFGRMRRQQQLLDAIKQKVTGLSLVWDLPKFFAISEAVSAHVETNLSSEEIAGAFRWVKDLPSDRIVIAPLDADREKGLFTTASVPFGEVLASVVQPIAGLENYDAVHAYVSEVIGQDALPTTLPTTLPTPTPEAP